MTKREAMRRTMMNDNLRRLGFTADECEQLRRISLTLRHWGERCCNEDIETRNDGSAWLTPHYGVGPGKPYRVPNREAGALRRLDRIFAPHVGRLTYCHQTDPRGAALYVVERARMDSRGITDANLDSHYISVGMAVY
jgi:hypothetical protein